ncbi:MAG: hypothetical protein FIB01_08605 [Gemmatimonadetes bacterium]|nr:hypothetical protein [Gemmatimonadota bacterium]
MPDPAPFKTCGSCRQPWSTWDDFVADRELRLLGLQAIGGVPDASLLVFEHSCGSSVSVLSKRLRDLLPDHPAAGWPSLRGSDQCPGHCIQLGDNARCELQCRNVRDRELIGLVQRLHQARELPPA